MKKFIQLGRDKFLLHMEGGDRASQHDHSNVLSPKSLLYLSQNILSN